MIGKDPDALDPSKRATGGLEAALEANEESDEIVIVDEKLKEQQEARREAKERAQQAVIRGKEEEPEQTLVEKELRAAPILERTSDRTTARILVITQDTSVFTKGSVAEKRLLEFSGIFAEIHVVVLTTKTDRCSAIERREKNIWLYPTDSRYWWSTIWGGYRLATRELVFGKSFRPDIIIADDPYEAGMVGALLAGRFDRPLQVHLFEDIYDPLFPDAAPHNRWRTLFSRYVLWKTDCVRTNSEFIKERIIEHHHALAEVTEVLPYYHDLAAWRDATSTVDLRERYPQFKFIILHVTNMSDASHTDRVINGCARTLFRYPTVGLIVIGDGPGQGELEKHVKRLQFEQKIVFETEPTPDLVSYMKSADILVHLSDNVEEDEIILQAAAAGLPIIAGTSSIAGELFVDGQDAFICPNDSPPCVSQKLTRFMNENVFRSQFQLSARDVVFERVEQDYGAYLRAYKSSIERCIIRKR